MKENLWLLAFTFLGPALLVAAETSKAGWHFVQNGTSGVLALEAIVVSETLALFLDRATINPLTINNHSAWAALWNMETNTPIPLELVSDSFCASGTFLSNGTMVSVAGNDPFSPETPAVSGFFALRHFDPCEARDGVGCTIFEDLEHIHLAEARWYASSLRIFDGTIMIVGGAHVGVLFYNIDPANTFEFYPSKDNGIPRRSAFLERSGPSNLFPRAFALPDGKVLMIAGNQTIIYDIENNIETRLPDIPNGVKVTNPFDGTATLLPLCPPDYIPEVLVCGGSNSSEFTPPQNLSSQDPASDQCSRITLTPEGIKKGWQIERLFEPRILLEFILLPNGQVLIINGGKSGYAALGGEGFGVPDANGGSNADHPVVTPTLYTPDAPLGHRLSKAGLPSSNIPRMYHSSVSLTASGNILIAGSNPNPVNVLSGIDFPTEYRVEYLNPPYMTVPRPTLMNVPKKIYFNTQYSVNVDIPKGLNTRDVKVSLMDLGFSSHAFHSSARLVFLKAYLSQNNRLLTFEAPPNNRIYPPGPGYIYLTVDNITSPGIKVMVGTGASPPVPDQGRKLKF